MEKSWNLLGQYDPKARTSFFGLALAIYLALETFGKHQYRYQVSMCVLILACGAYLAKRALNAHSIVGIATSIFTLIWIFPIFNESLFYSVDLTFMLAHSILSLAVAVGAFTYLKR